MSQGKYVLSTISRLLSARLLYRVFFALSVILVSNYLIADPTILDTFEVASSSVSIIMIITEVGMSMVVMRSGSQHKIDKLSKYYGTALVIETIAWISIFAGILGTYALQNGFTDMFWLLVILGIGQAIIQYRVVFRSIYRSLYKKEWITFIEVIDGILKLIGIYLVTHYIPDPAIGVYAICIVYTITTIIFVAIYGLSTLRYVKPKYERALVKPMLYEGIWFSMQALIMTVYFEADKLILRLFQNNGWAEIADGDIGRYAAASRLIIFLFIFHRIGLQVITPFLYSTFQKNMDRYRRIVQLATRYMGALGIAMGVGIFMLAEQIIKLIYAEELWGSIPALRLLGVFLIIRFIGITSSQIFATSNQQPLRTKLELASVILNIIIDIILIPIYGFMGAIVATLITETILQTVFYILSRKIINDPIIGSIIKIIPALFAGLLMSITLFFIRDQMHLLLSIPIGGTIYIVMLFAFKFVNKKDLALLK